MFWTHWNLWFCGFYTQKGLLLKRLKSVLEIDINCSVLILIFIFIIYIINDNVFVLFYNNTSYFTQLAACVNRPDVFVGSIYFLCKIKTLWGKDKTLIAEAHVKHDPIWFPLHFSFTVLLFAVWQYMKLIEIYACFGMGCWVNPCFLLLLQEENKFVVQTFSRETSFLGKWAFKFAQSL